VCVCVFVCVWWGRGGGRGEEQEEEEVEDAKNEVQYGAERKKGWGSCRSGYLQLVSLQITVPRIQLCIRYERVAYIPLRAVKKCMIESACNYLNCSGRITAGESCGSA
jgi:hypothetical protein